MFSDFAIDARTILALGAALYSGAFIFGLTALLLNRRYPRPAMVAFLGLAFFVQTFGLHIRGSAIQACPLGNIFEITQFIAWSLVLLFFIIGPAFKLGLLGFFTSGLATLLTAVPLFVPAWDRSYPPGLFGGNPWIEFHVSLAIFSYGIFAIVALVSAMFLIQEHGLKRKRFNGLYQFLPSVQQLDMMARRLLVTGLVFLSAALGTGVIFWINAPDLVPVYKLVAASLVWIGYIAVAVLRWKKKLVTRRHAITAIALFAFALLTLWPVQTARGSHAGKAVPHDSSTER